MIVLGQVTFEERVETPASAPLILVKYCPTLKTAKTSSAARGLPVKADTTREVLSGGGKGTNAKNAAQQQQRVVVECDDCVRERDVRGGEANDGGLST